MPAVHFSDQDFKEQVLEADKPVVVDFYAEWCGPCKMAAPIVDELADEYSGKVVVGKVDVDQNPETAQNFGVMSIPTMVVFKNGQEVERKVGFGGRAGVEALIKQVME
jgi:thioredoxin 1